MIRFINGLSEGSPATTGATLVLCLALVAIFALFDRRLVLAGLTAVYGAIFVLLRGLTSGSIVLLAVSTGFFVLSIVLLAQQQSQKPTPTISLDNSNNVALLLRIVSACIALALVWLFAQLITPLPPLIDGLVLPVFALCGIGLWLAFVGRELFRSGVGILLFLSGLLLSLGSAESTPILLGGIASLQLLVAIAIAYAVQRTTIDSIEAK